MLLGAFRVRTSYRCFAISVVGYPDLSTTDTSPRRDRCHFASSSDYSITTLFLANNVEVSAQTAAAAFNCCTENKLMNAATGKEQAWSDGLDKVLSNGSV